MPRQKSNGEYSQIYSAGPKAQYVPTTTEFNPPATILAAGNYTTGVIPSDGFYDFVVSAQLTQTGSIVLQRYVDDAGTIPLDAGISQALTASTLGVLILTDGKPCASFTIKISNTGGSTATVSNTAALISAH